MVTRTPPIFHACVQLQTHYTLPMSSSNSMTMDTRDIPRPYVHVTHCAMEFSRVRCDRAPPESHENGSSTKPRERSLELNSASPASCCLPPLPQPVNITDACDTIFIATLSHSLHIVSSTRYAEVSTMSAGTHEQNSDSETTARGGAKSVHVNTVVHGRWIFYAK